MPNTELISEYFDLPALQQQETAVNTIFDRVLQKFNEIKLQRADLNIAFKSSDVISGINAVNTSLGTLKIQTTEAVKVVDSLAISNKELKNRILETTLAQKEQALAISIAKEEARKKTIADKEAAIAEKESNELAAEGVRIRLANEKMAAAAIEEEIALKKQEVIAAQEALAADIEIAHQKILTIQQINVAEAEAAAEAANRRKAEFEAQIADAKRKGIEALPTVNAPQVVPFLPTSQIDSQVLALNKARIALAENKAEQAALTSAYNNGLISLEGYNAQTTALSKSEFALRGNIADLQGNIKNLTKENLTQEGSLVRLRAQLALLQKDYALLSATAKTSIGGIALQSQITTITTAISQQEQALGVFQRNVGNYGNAITGAFSKAFGVIRNLAYILPGIGIAGIFSLALDPIFKFGKYIFGAGEEAESAAKKIEKNKEEIKSLADGYRDFAAIQADALGGSIGTISKVEILAQAVKNQTLSYEERNNSLKELQKINKNYFGDLTLEQTSLEKLTGLVNEYTNALVAQAIVKELETDIGKAGSAFFKQARVAQQAVDEVNKQKEKLFSGKPTNPFLSEKIIEDLGKAGHALHDQQEALKPLKKNFDELFDELGNAIKLQGQYKPLGDPEKAKTDSEKLKAVTKKFFDDQLKDQAEQLKSVSKNDEFYLTDRIEKRKEAYRIEAKLANEAVLNEIQNEIAKFEAVVNNGKSSKTAKINATNEYNQRLQEINEKANYAELKLESIKDADLLTIRNSFYKKQRDIDKVQHDEDIKLLDQQAKDKLQKRLDLDALSNAQEVNRITGNQASEISSLNNRFAKEFAVIKGNKEKEILLTEQYARDRAEIEYHYSKQIVEQEIKNAEILLTIEKSNATGKDKIDIQNKEKQLADLKLKLSDLVSKHEITNNDAVTKSTQAKYKELETLLGKINNVYGQVSTIISNALNASATSKKNKIQDEIDLLTKRNQTEIDGINASTASAQDKAAKIAIITARNDAQKTALELKQRQIDERRARFEKALNIGKIITETALAVVHQLTSGDVYTALGRAIAAGALGAVQLAVAIATPIPKFKDGKAANNNYEGPAIWGDGGKSELRIREDGTMELSPDVPTLTTVKKTDIIKSDARAFLEGYNNSALKKRPLEQAVKPQTNDSLERTMKKGLTEVKNAIQNKPTAVIRHTLNGWVTGYEANQRYIQWVNRITR